VHEFLQAADRSVKQVEVEQGQHGNHNLVGLPEMTDQVIEITQGPKKSMKQDQGFPGSFFDEFELTILFDLVTHAGLVPF
jgi:hypothetical protein